MQRRSHSTLKNFEKKVAIFFSRMKKLLLPESKIVFFQNTRIRVKSESAT